MIPSKCQKGMNSEAGKQITIRTCFPWKYIHFAQIVRQSTRENSICLSDHPLYTSDLYMCTLANGEDPYEMLHNAAFHQGLTVC